MDRNLRVLGVGALSRTAGVSMMTPFFVLYLHNILGVGYAEVGALAVAIGIPPLLLTSVGGLVSDRVGHRRVFVASMAGEAVLLFATAAAMRAAALGPVLLAFAGFNVVATLGGPAVGAYIADLTSGSARTQGYTWYRVTHNVGFTIGTFVGGSLVGLIGFVAVAAVAGTFSAATALYLAVALDPSPYDRQLASPATATGPATRPGSVRRSLRMLTQDRTFLVLCLAFALATMVAAQWQLTFPLFVVGRLGLSYAVLGFGLGFNGLIVVFGQSATTNALLGRRQTWIGILGTIAYAVGFLVLGVAGEYGLMPLLAFFAAVFVLTIGENLLYIPQSTLPSNVAPPTEVGAYNGAFQTITGVGPLLAVFVGGVALSAIADPLGLWLVLILPLVPAVALLRWLGGRIPREIDRA